MKKTLPTLSAMVLTTALAAPAFAGGPTEPIIEPAPMPVITPAPVATGGDWTGFYAGGSLGYADVTGSSTLGDEVNGLTYGVHAGYLQDLGSIVLGGELELSGADITDDVSGLSVDSVARAKARVGYDAGQFMPYLTAGAAQLTTSGAIDDKDTGYFGGIGLDYQLSDQLTIGGEVLQHKFDDFAGSGIDVEAMSVSARVSFRF
ncbi:porin family protein [Loktanella sp. IMCC34160]|uniref:outer membrane protein n=1 Tax=Loktanella sp. IMCC34160 TaxID=2510646 RepID=UPI00101C5575|nr:porin family protein [Loktanella sp. IMCC34160]RYG91743.1 porin family protein [Loktanella sp. IMCC34160]